MRACSSWGYVYRLPAVQYTMRELQGGIIGSALIALGLALFGIFLWMLQCAAAQPCPARLPCPPCVLSRARTVTPRVSRAHGSAGQAPPWLCLPHDLCLAGCPALLAAPQAPVPHHYWRQHFHPGTVALLRWVASDGQLHPGKQSSF